MTLANTATSDNTRNYGIDLLKMLSMLMVLILHILNVGGILKSCAPGTATYEAAWVLNICSTCAVNCFALASGYVMVQSKFKYHRIVVLWLQVVFYSLICAAVFQFFLPDSIGFVRAFLPITMDRYWYFTAYFGMFFFIPFFNHLLNTLHRRDAFRLLVTIVILFSVIPTFSTKDTFDLSNGYSLLWLSAMYLIGGYCKKYAVGDRCSKKKALFMYISAVLITWGSRHLFTFIKLHAPEWMGKVYVFKFLLEPDLFVKYLSPTMLLAGISLLILFSKLDIRNKGAVGLVRFFAPLSFSVYIIHTNPLIWNNVLVNRFVSYSGGSFFALILSVLATALVIYFGCSLIDWLRLKLFGLLRINRLSMAFTGKVHKLLAKKLPVD